MTGVTLFPGECEIDQMFKIFRILGTPTVDECEDVLNYQHFNTRFPKWPKINLNDLCDNPKQLKALIKSEPIYSKLNSIFKRTNNDFIEMLSHVLEYDVNKRWNVSQIANSK